MQAQVQEKKNQKETSNYDFFISVGICPNCRKRALAPGHKSCPVCLERHRKFMAESRRKKAREI